MNTHRLLISSMVVGLLGVLVCFLGFFRYINDVSNLSAPQSLAALKETDTIVVLTGGSERVAKGVDLLKVGKAQTLFISGVHPGLSLDGLLTSLGVTKETRACCITLGYQAESTLGNAEETREWMNHHHYKSMRLVTANYHLPRSLLLMHALLPNVTILPYGVVPETLNLSDWWMHPGTSRLLFTEFLKYSLVVIRQWLY